jgi:hypothetical protein
MSKLPTDLKIFKALYKEYAGAFQDFKLGEPSRATKIYVPIDVKHVAKLLGTDAHELFGRLYYHLDHSYRYKQDDGAYVHLFAFQVGPDRHCINYPYLAAILADQKSKHLRELWALGLSILSLIVAGLSLASDVWGKSA